MEQSGETPVPDHLGTPRKMDVKIKATVGFTLTGTALEDALAEYDELSVVGLLKEVVDKGIACDDIEVEVTEGPNTLEEYDSQQG